MASDTMLQHLQSFLRIVLFVVQVLNASPHAGSDCGQVVHTHVPLSPSSMIW